MRVVFSFFILLLLCACGGGSQTQLPANNSSTTTLFTDKSSPTTVDSAPLDLSNGLTAELSSVYWHLDTPISYHSLLPKTNSHPNAPSSYDVNKQKLKAISSFFKFNIQGHVDTYSLFEAELADDEGNFSTERCIHKEPQAETWSHLQENVFRVYNNGQSIEVQMQISPAKLEIEQRNGVLVYTNSGLTKEDFDDSPKCLDLFRDQLPFEPLIHNNLLLSPKEMKGLWRIENVIEPVSIAFTGMRSKFALRKYIEFSPDSAGKVWLYDEKRECFHGTGHEIQYSADSNIFTQINTLDQNTFDRIHTAYRVNLNISDGAFGQYASTQPALYFLYTNKDIFIPPSYLVKATVAEYAEKNMCEISKQEREQLAVLTRVDDLLGVWSLSSENETDLLYLHVTDTLEFIRYDYRGDSFNNGENCYQELWRSSPLWLSDNVYEEVNNISYNNLISLFTSNNGELLIASNDNQNYEYNRLLKRAAEVEKKGITPLCPTLRN